MKKQTYITACSAGTCRIEWAEPGKRARKVVTRSKHRVTGKYPSWKARRMLQWESLQERDAFILHDVDPCVRTFREQPVRLLFEMDGQVREHYPDLYVETQAGSTFREIKTDDEARDPYIQARTACLAARLSVQGHSYELLAESEIRREPRLSNARLVLRYGRQPLGLAERERLRRTLTEAGQVLWGDIWGGCLGPRGVSQICRLVLEGVVAIDLNSHWNDNTPVALAELIR